MYKRLNKCRICGLWVIKWLDVINNMICIMLHIYIYIIYILHRTFTSHNTYFDYTFIPIGSMVLLYMVTWIPSIYPILWDMDHITSADDELTMLGPHLGDGIAAAIEAGNPEIFFWRWKRGRFPATPRKIGIELGFYQQTYGSCLDWTSSFDGLANKE